VQNEEVNKNEEFPIEENKEEETPELEVIANEEKTEPTSSAPQQEPPIVLPHDK